jgi:superfamily II DNA or RNA helicase/HKD family nuclease
MDNNSAFITNSKIHKLKERLVELINSSKELKFLVGFFYYSGISELYEGLKNRTDLQINILVGLNVEKTINGLVEYGDTELEISDQERVERFFDSVAKSINSDQFDSSEFYEQSSFFLKLIQEGKLVIRKTENPNHAKLYLFKLKDGQFKDSVFITGSSNLTKAGINTQEEFNVEISDYGTKEADQYFDELWQFAAPITEKDEYKDRLIDLLKNKTLIAEVTPFEAFVLVLKTYLEALEQNGVKQSVTDLLQKRNYTTYAYQLDAVKQALTIIDHYGGVIVSDVVGLGKSVIASLIAKSLNKRGVIICPPALIGDKQKKSGWQKYREDFALHDWEIYSSGDLERTLEFVRGNDEIEVIIIDEAHRFRNQDTKDYELLSNICRNKIVILLTATPFNNSPADIFSLVKLFITPGKSKITLDNNLSAKFQEYNRTFERLSFINKNHASANPERRQKAQNYYEAMFGQKEVNLEEVNKRARYLASSIKSAIEPILIRRNRIDLKKDPVYSKEVAALSDLQDPQELFYDLTKEQSEFYDKVINDYFGENGQFKGAIYRPFAYEIGELNVEKIKGAEANFEFRSQTNLYEFMKRLLVKRFESSFGAFRQSIRNFEAITKKVLEFIETSGEKYILDRALLEKIYDLDPEEIQQELEKFTEELSKGDYPKTYKVYDVSGFKLKDKFLQDIQSDLEMFVQLLKILDDLSLVDKDPKTARLVEAIKTDITEKQDKNEPHRKVVIFSEYVDTIKYLEPQLQKYFADKLITVKGDLTSSKVQEILENFDASYDKQSNQYQVLLTSDKISEGFNLNRAGAIINYDIPWNPTRVIQRVGRINRIGKKVFQNLYIYNFFPTEQGADVVKSRQIASNKMFLIHNTLGEDAKIFDVDETPSASKLFKRIQQNPEENDQESLQTKARKAYYNIEKNYPEIIAKTKNLPPRVKVAKKFSTESLNVFIKKGLGFFVRGVNADSEEVSDKTLEEVWNLIECDQDEPSLPLSPQFWEKYEAVKNFKETYKIATSEQSNERKAINNLKTLLSQPPKELLPLLPLVRMLLEDALEYQTLSDYTLRRIAGLNTAARDVESIKELVANLADLKQELGEDYLLKTKQKLANFTSEVIIAIENRNL